ncbi:CCDC91 isoform 3, partial [Pan troglodytes]
LDQVIRQRSLSSLELFLSCAQKQDTEGLLVRWQKRDMATRISLSRP